jgi:glucose-1-phosphate adenylyltransferase
VTIGCLEVPRMEATGFGVMHVDEHDTHHRASSRKPADPPGIPGNPDMALASMGIYVFDTKFLIELRKRRRRPQSSRDFGKDIIPTSSSTARPWRTASAASCVRPALEAEAYWRDVGTIDAYWEANIDLTDVTPNSTSTTATGRSGPMPSVHRRRPSSCMTRMPPRQRRGLAGVGRLHRLGPQ